MNDIRDMERILQNDIKVPDVVQKRLDETYAQIKGKEGRKIMRKNKSVRIAAAAAAGILFVTAGAGTAYAVSKKSVPQGIDELFGADSRQNVESQVITVDNGKGQTDVLIPGTEYTDLDEILAGDTFDGFVSENPVECKIGDYTLTVMNYVTDGQTLCAYMTLECESGITAMYGDWRTNISKGLRFTDESEFTFSIAGSDTGSHAGYKMYLNLDKSTDTKYYIYYYGVWTDGTETSPYIEINDYGMPRKDIPIDEKGYRTVNPAISRVDLEKVSALQTYTVKENDKTLLTYSTISLSLDTLNMQSVMGGDYFNIDNIDLIEIVYKDGSSYIVYQHNVWDNTGYLCGGLGENNRVCTMTFNRLVDVNEISQIIINDYVCDIN
jgi:hypothetical protein